MTTTLNATSSSGLVATADNSTTLALQTNGTTGLYMDSAQNVGIGTSSPSYKLDINGTSQIRHQYTGSSGGVLLGQYNSTGDAQIQNQSTSGIIAFATNNSERMRFTSSGAIWKNYTSEIFSASAYQIGISFAGASQQGLVFKNTDNNAAGAAVRFVDYLGNFSGGGIYYTSSNSISYTTTSDYRLKNNIKPMSYGLNTISALKPVTYKWNVDDAYGEGFIAHELKEIIPSAVIGEKDGIDANDNPSYQSVDYSKIVVHLVAAIQELTAEVEALKAKVGS